MNICLDANNIQARLYRQKVIPQIRRACVKKSIRRIQGSSQQVSKQQTLLTFLEMTGLFIKSAMQI
jgi:hypothetical protein